MSLSVTDAATRLVADLGYWGLGAGLVIDSMGVPIPSEVLVPVAVVATTQEKLALWAVVVVSVAAQILGASLSYLVGRQWGLAMVERFGPYVLVSGRHVERTERVFARHGGWITAAGRCLPVVRGLIGYPAGAANMNRSRFVLWTSIGTAAWTAFLVFLGELLSAHLHAIDHAFSNVETVIAVLFAAMISAAVWRSRRHRKSTEG